MLKGKRVILRPIERADLPRLVEFANDLDLHALSGFHAWTPQSLSARQARFEKDLTEKESDVEFAVDVDGILIGDCQLTQLDREHRHCMLGITIGDRDYWGKGYGEDVMRTLLDYAFGHLNMHRVHLGVFSTNERARRLYTKIGFVHEGIDREIVFKEGRYIDNIRMSILDREWNERAQHDLEIRPP